MAEHTGRANWFERLREKRRERKAKAAANVHANRKSKGDLERTRRESGVSKGGFGGDGGGFGGMESDRALPLRASLARSGLKCDNAARSMPAGHRLALELSTRIRRRGRHDRSWA